MRVAFQVMEKPLAGLRFGARILIDLATLLNDNIATSARSEVCLLVHILAAIWRHVVL